MSQAQSSRTAEQVLALAPDAASAKAGQGLASPKKWSNLGRGEGMVWGECQGSGASPYQAKADPAGPAFSCSCPSRKFPCKHAIGLLLIWAASPDSLAEGSPPSWVASWKENREKKAEKAREKQEQPPSPVDPAARKKRESARASKVASGLDDLSLWLSDLVRQGFASLSTKPASLWTDQARRMVDAQAPGVARRLRQIDDSPLAGDGWQANLLDRLARIHLLIEGFRRLDDLVPDLADDVRSAIGFPADLDAIRDGQGVRDRWQVIGQAVALEEKLTVFRTWLIGRESGRPALLLDYSAAGRPLEMTLPPGFVVDADLAFFPGSTPLRALIKTRHADPVPIDDLPDGSTVADAFARFGEAMARNPWLEYFPVVLAGVVLSERDGAWSARDASESVMPLSKRFSDGWHLLALGGGGPITLAGEFDGASLDPLSACVAGRFVRLAARKEPIGSGPTSAPVMVPFLTEITASAIVGVDRRPPPSPSSDNPIGLVLVGLESKDPAARLLGLAAASGVHGRSGRVPRLDDSPLPDVSPPENRPECSPEVASRLRRMLGGEHSECFPEFIDLLASSGRRLPNDAVAEVLARAENPSIGAENLRDVLGTRGRWLASKNPKWRKSSGHDPSADPAVLWETGDPHARLSLLRELRKADPALGRELVASTFGAEPASRRAEFVAELERGLSMHDEPFLEAALDDRGQDVRRRAAELLRKLPDSRLVRRMIERARGLLAWNRGLPVIGRGSISVELPQACDPAMARDGVDPRPPAHLKIGQKAWWLREVVSSVPTGAIAAMLGASAGRIVEASRGVEWEDILWPAWTAAAVSHGDAEWAEALLDVVGEGEVARNRPQVSELVGILGPDRRDGFLLRLLRADASPSRSEEVVSQALRSSKIPIGPALAGEVLSRLRAILASERREFADPARRGAMTLWSGALADPKYHDLRTAGRIAGLAASLPLDLAEEIAGGFVADDGPPLYYVSEFAKTLDFLRFRRDMHREFAP